MCMSVRLKTIILDLTSVDVPQKLKLWGFGAKSSLNAWLVFFQGTLYIANSCPVEALGLSMKKPTPETHPLLDQGLSI